MAIWQFPVIFIPVSWAEANSYSTSSLYDEDGYDTEIVWNDRQPKSSFRTDLATILPPSKSWSDDLLMWGDVKEHDIQVWFEAEKVCGIDIRLDLNQNLNEIIIKIIKVARSLGCVLFYPEFNEIVDANEFELIKAIKKSSASKFVNDPQGFINGLGNKL